MGQVGSTDRKRGRAVGSETIEATRSKRSRTDSEELDEGVQLSETELVLEELLADAPEHSTSPRPTSEQREVQNSDEQTAHALVHVEPAATTTTETSGEREPVDQRRDTPLSRSAEQTVPLLAAAEPAGPPRVPSAPSSRSPPTANRPSPSLSQRRPQMGLHSALVAQSLRSALVVNLLDTRSLCWLDGDDVSAESPPAREWERFARRLDSQVTELLQKWQEDERAKDELPEIAADALNELLSNYSAPPPPLFLRSLLPQVSYFTRRFGSRFLDRLHWYRLFEWIKSVAENLHSKSPGLASLALDFEALSVFLWNMLLHGRYDQLRSSAANLVGGYSYSVLRGFMVWNERLVFLEPRAVFTQFDVPFKAMRAAQERTLASVLRVIELAIVHTVFAGRSVGDLIERTENVLLADQRFMRWRMESSFARVGREKLESSYSVVLSGYSRLRASLAALPLALLSVPRVVTLQTALCNKFPNWPNSVIDMLLLLSLEETETEQKIERRRECLQQLRRLREELGLRAALEPDGSERCDAVGVSPFETDV